MKNKKRRKMENISNEERIKQLQNQVENYQNLLDKQEREKEEIKNRDFIQIYRKSIIFMRNLNKIDPNALPVLLILLEKMNKQNAVLISQKALSQITGKTRQTINKAIKALKEGRYIQIIKVGTANVYVVNASIAWTNSNNKKYQAFSAQVVADIDEQIEEDWKNIKLKQLPMYDDIKNLRSKDLSGGN